MGRNINWKQVLVLAVVAYIALSLIVGAVAGQPPSLNPIRVAGDIDCLGGSGNGPRYAQGPVYVGSSDPNGLDADGDGWGCE